MIRNFLKWIKRLIVVKVYVFKNMEIEVKYTDQAELIIAKIIDFDKEQFEADTLNKIVIGDATIWRYVLSKEMNNKRFMRASFYKGAK